MVSAAESKARRETGMTFTCLRDNFYVDVPLFADEHGVIRGPAGTGLFAPVARADVADVAATVCARPPRTRTRRTT